MNAEVWEVWGPFLFPIKTKNLQRTLNKILKYLEQCGSVVIHKNDGIYYYHLDYEAVQKLLSGQSCNVIATLEPPTFRGCKAHMYVILSPQKLFAHGDQQ
jgi:transcription initiation factor IIE alpha subunit